MTDWHPKAAEEIKRLAHSRQHGADSAAGEMYELADRLTSERADGLPKLGGGNPDIRWWDSGDWTVYVRVDVSPMRVVKVGKTRTGHQRTNCERDARARS